MKTIYALSCLAVLSACASQPRGLTLNQLETSQYEVTERRRLPIDFPAVQQNLFRHAAVCGQTYTFEMAPMIVQQGKEHYPENVLEKLKGYGAVFALNATEKAAALGNVAVVNILMLGIAAARMDIDKEIWRKAIENNVPERFRKMNENAFEIGFGYAIQGSDFL